MFIEITALTKIRNHEREQLKKNRDLAKILHFSVRYVDD